MMGVLLRSLALAAALFALLAAHSFWLAGQPDSAIGWLLLAGAGFAVGRTDN